jgi:DNA-binding response OmpR family regulator
MARILVVDDHPPIVRLLQRELVAEAHEVLTAATGEEALQKARHEQPDLMVLDVMMPGKSGFEVLQELKADPKTQAIIVVMLTARDQPSDISYGLQLGADWYLTKPFRPGEVGILARRFLEGHRRPAVAPREAPLPLGEIDSFTLAAADAFELAVQGSVAEGLDCLLSGLRRADAARADGQPWAEELARRYEEVRDHYLSRYGWKAAQSRGMPPA